MLSPVIRVEELVIINGIQNDPRWEGCVYTLEVGDLLRCDDSVPLQSRFKEALSGVAG